MSPGLHGELLNCHRSVAVDPSMCLKVPASIGAAGSGRHAELPEEICGGHLPLGGRDGHRGATSSTTTSSDQAGRGRSRCRRRIDCRSQRRIAEPRQPAAGPLPSRPTHGQCRQPPGRRRQGERISEKSIMGRPPPNGRRWPKQAGKTEAKADARRLTKADTKSDGKSRSQIADTSPM